MTPPYNWAPPHYSGHSGYRLVGNTYTDQYHQAPRLPPPERLIAGPVGNVAPAEFQRSGDRPPPGHMTPYPGPYHPNTALQPAPPLQLPPPRYLTAESGPPHRHQHQGYTAPDRAAAGLPPASSFRTNPAQDRRMSHISPDRPVLQHQPRPLQDFPPPPTAAPPPLAARQGNLQPPMQTPIMVQGSTRHPSPLPAIRQPDRTSRPMQIPNLIGDDRASALSDIVFKLKLRQQPKAARSCGFGERDRRVIDPPPIVELVIESSEMTEDEIRNYRCYESYVMSCSIWDETGTRDASYMPEEYRHQRRLMGSLVGTPFVGKDEFSNEGCFFTFADLSCRTPGSFRLKFSVIMIDPRQAGAVRHFPILTEIKSEVFTVYNAKDFPGMLASSELAHKLKAQGCILQLKKGNDRTKGSRNLDDSSDDGDDDDDDEDDGDKSKASQGRRKRRSIRC